MVGCMLDPEVPIGINATHENESKFVPSYYKARQPGINCNTLDVHESGTTRIFFLGFIR